MFSSHLIQVKVFDFFSVSAVERCACTVFFISSIFAILVLKIPTKTSFILIRCIESSKLRLRQIDHTILSSGNLESRLVRNKI